MYLDIIWKAVIGGLIIGIVSSLAQKNPTLGAIIMGIPMVSFITLIIMYYPNGRYYYNSLANSSIERVSGRRVKSISS